MATQIERMKDLFDEYGLEYSDCDKDEGGVIVLQQGMVKTTGHYGLRSHFLFDKDGKFESYEVIDEDPLRNKPE